MIEWMDWESIFIRITDKRESESMGILSTLKSIRGYRSAEVFAMLGMAFSLVGMESWRAPNVAAQGGIAGTVISSSDLLVLSLVILALIYWKCRKRLADRPYVLPVIAFLAAATIFCHVNLESLSGMSVFFTVFARFHAAFAGALFILWIEVVLNEYADEMAGFMAFTFIITFIIQMAFISLHTENIPGFTALIPVLSALCFVGYQIARARQIAVPISADVEGEQTRDTAETLVEEAAERLPKDPRKHPVLHFVFVCFVWLCCGIIFAMLFRTWYNSDAYAAGDLYTEIQIFTALGTLVAALVLLVLSHPVRRGLLEIIIVAMVLAAILLSGIGTRVFVAYLIPLNTAQKLLFVSILRSSEELEDRGLGMTLYCVLLAAYRLGLALSNRIRNLFIGELFRFTPESVDFVIFAVCTIVLVVFFILEIASMLKQAQRATVEAASEAVAEVDAIAAAKEAKYREGAFHYYLMQKFDLTQRESEVLRLFEGGLTVKQIAEEQVVSESTVKTHLSNVYPKLGVKTRKEALAKIQSEREHFFTA